MALSEGAKAKYGVPPRATPLSLNSGSGACRQGQSYPTNVTGIPGADSKCHLAEALQQWLASGIPSFAKTW